MLMEQQIDQKIDQKIDQNVDQKVDQKTEKTQMREVLDLAMNMGRVLLKNGAEIFRVEETIDHVCRRYQIEDVESFVMSNGIFITARDEEEDIYAKVKHIPLSGFHLGIVTEVNDLSREISAGRIGLEGKQGQGSGKSKPCRRSGAGSAYLRQVSGADASVIFCRGIFGRA